MKAIIQSLDIGIFLWEWPKTLSTKDVTIESLQSNHRDPLSRLI